MAAVQLLLAYKAFAVAGWWALLFAGERLAPADRREAALRPGRARLARNLGLWLVTVAGSALVVLPLTAWAAGHALWVRPAWWQGGFGLGLDLLLLDFLIYWWHRANHRFTPLWRFHEVHHLDGFLDSTSALRFHFGEVLISAGARAVVVVALAFPLASVLVFETVVLVATLFHHSNLRLPPGLEAALSRLVITPSIHWVHHHARKADTNSNYGTVLSLWDRLFASRNRRPRTPGMAIGVEGGRELAFGALLLRPFAARERAPSGP